ncbi:MAG: hypothetical protein HQ526_10730, partial [Actinobacteria bacterium]|nr:hypothetical protein [Actinomycetota bacterium]
MPTLAQADPTSTGVSISASSNSTQSAQIPIAPGLSPRTLTASLSAPTSLNGGQIRPGVVQVLSGTDVLFERAAGATEFTANLRPRNVVGGSLPISLRYTVPDTSADFCTANDQSVTLADIRIDNAGTQQPPTTIATFLEPGAPAINVVIPAAESTDVMQAGLVAVGALTDRYSTETEVRLSVGAADPTITSAPSSRIVEISTGPNPVTTSISSTGGIPQLNLVGSGDELAAAARSLGSVQTPLATSGTTGGLTQVPGADGGLTRTLADLGNAQPTLRGWGT